MKHKVSKQFLSVLLALVMVIGLIPPSTLTVFAEELEPINSVSLSGLSMPVVGERISSVSGSALSEGQYGKNMYTVIDNQTADWMDEEGRPIEYGLQVFEAGRTYSISFNVGPKDGYAFTDSNIPVYMNNLYEYQYTGSIALSKETKIATVTYTFELAGERTYADISEFRFYNVTAPSDGDQAHYNNGVWAYNNSEMTDQYWADSEGNRLNPNTVFEGGYSYSYNYEFTAFDGYQFADNVSIRNDAVVVDWEYSFNADNTKIYITIPYYIESSAVIDSVTVEDMFLPTQGGSTRDFDSNLYQHAPSGANYTVPNQTNGWYETTAEDSSETQYEVSEKSFIAGKQYKTFLVLHANDNYKFASSENISFAFSGISESNYSYVITSGGSESIIIVAITFTAQFPEGTGTINNPVVCSTYEEMKYALEHPTVQGIVVNSFTNDPYQTFYTLEKEKDFKAGRCAITVPAGTTKYLTINADINIRVPYIDYLLYSFIDNRGSLTVGGTGSLNVSMNARGYPSAIIYNNGELNIGGNVTFDPTNHSFDSVHGYSVFTANGHAVINSGTFFGYDASAVSYYGGCLDIYDGTFKVKNGDEQAFGLNADSYLSVAEHNVNLYGGTFDGIRSDQSIGADIAKLPDLLGYGAYYTYTSDGSKFDPSGKLDTHETLTVKMNNIVRDVALTVTAPKEGSKPSYTVGCASDAYYAVGGSSNYTDYRMWMESDDGENNWREMDINDVFITGKYYKFVVDIKTASGNMFPLYDNGSSIVPDVSATVNGYYARVIKAYDQDPSTYITVEYNFGMCNDDVVENITITNIDAPVAGQTPDYTANCFGTGYSMAGTNSGNWKVNGIVWLRDGNIYTGSIMDNTEKFQPGHEYTVIIDLVADYGYTFLFNNGNSIYAAAAINGNTAQINIDRCSTTEYQVWYTFTCSQAEVSAVEVSGIDAPVAGQTPDYTGTVGNAALYGFANYGYNAAGFWWYDSEDKPLTSEDKFVAGETYKLEIKLTSAMIDQVAVSRFKTPVTATLNGKAVDSSDVMANSSTVYIYQTYTCKEASAFVSGSVTSFNDASGDITLQLIPEGLNEPAYETIVTGNTVDYYFADVAPGTYTLKVMKKNHVTREYTVVVGNSSVIQNVYLCLLGDVNEDGLLNSADYSMIVAHVKCNVVFDDVQKSAADLTRDGVVDAFDAIYLDLYLNSAVELP